MLYCQYTNVRAVTKRLEADGWRLDRMRGSHRRYKHPTKPNVITGAGKDSEDMPVGTLHEIWRNAGLKE